MSGKQSKQPLSIALLGAGGFVHDAWLPALAALGHEVRVTDVWSRGAKSAEAAAAAIQGFSPSCRSCHGDDGLQALLRSSEVDAVLVVLPPQVQGAVIHAALTAGKHVLSEKPAAPTLQQAVQLLAFHRSLPQPAPLWCVAENYRSMGAFLRLRNAIASGVLGTVARLDMAVDLALAPGNKYFDSSWRRDSDTMPGAYLTEAGVHFVAALRMAASAAGWGEATAAAASTQGISPDLPHPDTLQGLVWFESGAAASYSMVTGAALMHVALRAVGTAGAAEAERGGGAGPGRSFRLVLQTVGQAMPTEEQLSSSGVQEELLSFCRLVRAAAASSPRPGAPTRTAREAGATAGAGGSDPEHDAVGGAAGGAAVGAPAAGTPGRPRAGPPAGPQTGLAGAGGAEPTIVEGSGKARLKDMPSDEDAWRVSCVEAVRDLEVVTALLKSAAADGEKVLVVQF